MIVPDIKDWTWVLDRPCPECGVEAATLELARLPAMIRTNAAAWGDMLADSSNVTARPSDDRWSALEYACHVRDVFALYDFRLHLMLDRDDPTFPNWDQDKSALDERYREQDPAVVAPALRDAADRLADSFAGLTGDDWRRTGKRSDGAHFTIESFGRYLIHDPIHHLHDVASMPGVSLAPTRAMERLAVAEAKLVDAIASLGDDDVRRPSLLPSWTIGHVLTHVARNADSHRRRTEAAGRGESTEQYQGGFEGRAAAIEAGAGRPASQVLDDVRQSSAAMQSAWNAIGRAGVWIVTSNDVGGTPRMLRELPLRRWQEVEIHLIDLGVGVTRRDWPDDFVAWKLADLRRGLADRLPPGAAPPPPGSLDERDELAWLLGRWQRADLPVLSAWG